MIGLRYDNLLIDTRSLTPKDMVVLLKALSQISSYDMARVHAGVHLTLSPRLIRITSWLMTLNQLRLMSLT